MAMVIIIFVAYIYILSNKEDVEDDNLVGLLISCLYQYA